jgi:hypothetical protein
MKPTATLRSAYYKQTRVSFEEFSFLGDNTMWSSESLLVACFMLVSSLAYSSALKVATFSSKMSVNFHQTTQDSKLNHTCICEFCSLLPFWKEILTPHKLWQQFFLVLSRTWCTHNVLSNLLFLIKCKSKRTQHISLHNMLDLNNASYNPAMNGKWQQILLTST